jgi:hypothetical protein
VTYHVYDVSVHTYEIGLQVYTSNYFLNSTNNKQTLLVGELLFMSSTSLIKVTFCMTLLRVIKRPLFPYIRFCLYMIMAIVVVQEVFFFFYTLFSCSPITYFWEQLDPAKKGMRISVIIIHWIEFNLYLIGHCMSHAMALSFTHGSVVFCSDTILAGIVAYLISHLQLGRKTKIASGVLLSLGSM